MTVTLHEVLDFTGSLTINGASGNATLSTPGQRALWTFTGTANQQVRGVINSSTIGSCSSGTFSMLRPDQSVLISKGVVCATTMGPVTLPTTGVYTLVVDPWQLTGGNVTVSVVSP